MSFKGIMGFEEINFLCRDYREAKAQGRSTPLTELMEIYCENATEYAYLMKKAGFKVDFLFETLQGIPLGIGLFHSDNLRNKTTPDESFERVKEQIAGYLMFALYNGYVDEGYSADFEMNDDGTGLRLNVDDGEDGCIVIDIPEMVDRAFRFVRLEGEDIYCNSEGFIQSVTEEL